MLPKVRFKVFRQEVLTLFIYIYWCEGSGEILLYPCLFSLKGVFRSNIFLGFSVETSFADLKKKKSAQQFLLERKSAKEYSKKDTRKYMRKKSVKESMKRKSCTINHICPHFYISLQPTQKQTDFKWIFFVVA